MDCPGTEFTKETAMQEVTERHEVPGATRSESQRVLTDVFYASQDALLVHVAHAGLSTLLLAVVEQVYFGLSYAGELVDGGTRVRLVFLSLSLATVLALPFALVAWLGERATQTLERLRMFETVALGIRLQSLTLLALGMLLALSQGGRLLAIPPIWQLAVAALPAAAFHLVVRRWARSVDAARYNLGALLSVAFCAWFLASLDTIGNVLNGQFGFGTRVAQLRTAVTFAVPLAMMTLLAIWSRRELLLGSRRKRGLNAAASTFMLVALHHANLNLYVDSYPEIHTFLFVASALTAWHLVDAVFGWSLKRLRARSRGARIAFGGALSGAVACLMMVDPTSSPGYIASVHTVQARYAMDLLHGDVLRAPERLKAKFALLRQIWWRGHGEPPLPRAPLGPLPDGFRPVVRDPTLPRPPLDGVVIFFLDMKRPRDIGAYGRADSRTPMIDRCFAGGHRFWRAFSAGTSTGVSFPAIYSSTYAATRQQWRYGKTQEPFWFTYQDGNNLVDTFKRSGFHTAVLTNRFYVQFFTRDEWSPVFGRFDEIIREKPGLGHNEGLAAAYRERGGLIPKHGRFLRVVHLMSHELEDIGGVDAVVGEVCSELERSGRAPRTALLLTSDHGVQFGEHGRQTYGRTTFNEEALVPVLFKVPGIAGRDVTANISSLDHFATLVDLLQLDARFGVEGRSYLPALHGRALDPARPIFIETRHRPFPSTAVIVGDMKLIEWHTIGSRALFSLRADLGERRSLAEEAAHRADLEAMSSLLERFVSERGE